jgi:hypothetical protein
MVRFDVPVAAVAATVTEMLAVFPVILDGVTVAVTPAGAPVTATATAPVKLERTRLSVTVPVPPWATDNVVGTDAMVNDAADPEVTVSVNVAETAETPVPVAVTVIG